ncbi:MAG: hypothetical protein WCI89_02810 [bacterium]
MNEQLDRIEKKMVELEGKLDATYAAAHKVLVYIKWTGIITVAVIVIPLFILPFFIPSFLASQGVGAGSINSLLGQ